MDKLAQIKKKIEEIQAKSAVSQEIRAFITLVLSVVNKSKEELANLSKENIKVIKESLSFIEEQNKKLKEGVTQETSKQKEEFEKRVTEIKSLISKIETIKPIDGKDGLDGLDGKDGIDGKDGSPDTRKEIVEKINTGGKEKIELKQIEGAEKIESNILARATSILDQRTKFLINKNVKHDSTLTGSGTDSDPLSVVSSGDYVEKSGDTMTGALRSTVVTLTDGATPALDASLGNTFHLSAEGNRTIAIPSNPPGAGIEQKITIRHTAVGGARTLSLNTGAGGFRFGSDITGLTETASGETDYIGAIYNSIDGYFDVVAYVKGY